MNAWTRNMLVAGGLTLLLLSALSATFYAGAHPRSRAAVLGTFGNQLEEFSSLEDRETLEYAERRTEEIITARNQSLGVAEQKQLLTLWHGLGIWDNMWFLGIRIKKNPMDLWMMNNIIAEVRPDFIIETGTDHGGSALYWAASLDLLGLKDSRVITIDIDDRTAAVSDKSLWNDYVEFMHSSSTDSELVAAIGERVRGSTVLVALDSNHQAYHVLQELQMYGPMVTPGSYLVVEDTNMDGVPVAPGFGPGPMTAVIQYLEGDGGELFDQDLTREAYVLTFNPGGWLRRKAQ